MFSVSAWRRQCLQQYEHAVVGCSTPWERLHWRHALRTSDASSVLESVTLWQNAGLYHETRVWRQAAGLTEINFVVCCWHYVVAKRGDTLTKLVPETFKHSRPIKPHNFDHVPRCEFLIQSYKLKFLARFLSAFQGVTSTGITMFILSKRSRAAATILALVSELSN